MKKIAIIGSHGLYASYGGWDQLVINLAEEKSNQIEYLIFNPSETSKKIPPPPGVIVKHLPLSASGYQGLLYDFWSILYSLRKVDIILLLGVQGMPIIPFIKLVKKIRVITNIGGVEWARPKFSFFVKHYLKMCYRISLFYSEHVIIDNKYYNQFVPDKTETVINTIPYGGTIDNSLKIENKIIDKYPFLVKDYYLSVSRSLEDNKLDELCNAFAGKNHLLVLISNFSNSKYGQLVQEKYSKFSNIILINGLYVKPELDLIRRNCKAYIHSHTLCGTAPSLVEMIVAARPIFSIDVPQNRNTLNGCGFFFSDFNQIISVINNKKDLSKYIPHQSLSESYEWKKIVKLYEELY